VISGALLPPRAITPTVGEKSSKPLLQTFPEVGISCRTLAPGSLCTAKDPGRWLFCTTHDLCYADFLMAASHHQCCEKPVLLLSQTRGVELLGSMTKPNT